MVRFSFQAEKWKSTHCRLDRIACFVSSAVGLCVLCILRFSILQSETKSKSFTAEIAERTIPAAKSYTSTKDSRLDTK